MNKNDIINGLKYSDNKKFFYDQALKLLNSYFDNEIVESILTIPNSHLVKRFLEYEGRDMTFNTSLAEKSILSTKDPDVILLQLHRNDWSITKNIENYLLKLKNKDILLRLINKYKKYISIEKILHLLFDIDEKEGRHGLIVREILLDENIDLPQSIIDKIINNYEWDSAIFYGLIQNKNLQLSEKNIEKILTEYLELDSLERTVHGYHMFMTYGVQHIQFNKNILEAVINKLC